MSSRVMWLDLLAKYETTALNSAGVVPSRAKPLGWPPLATEESASITVAVTLDHLGAKCSAVMSGKSGIRGMASQPW